MSNGFQKRTQQWQRLYRGTIAALLTSSSLVTQCWLTQTAQAQTLAYCWLSNEAIAQKQNFLVGTLKGNSDSENRYKALIKQHAESLRQCRERTWPNVQAIWLRLYPCDARAGAIDEILDRLVSRGYNQVNVEVFNDGQVLLPVSDNPTPWPSLIRTPKAERLDLLSQIIQKGRSGVYGFMLGCLR
jgi:hypothetical protein